MKLYMAALLLLLLGGLSPVHGILEAFNTNLKCKCSGSTSKSIPTTLIEKIQVFPPGNGCPNTEVIIWTKTKLVICLTSNAKWVKRLLKHLYSRSMHSTPPAPVSKRKPA